MVGDSGALDSALRGTGPLRNREGAPGFLGGGSPLRGVAPKVYTLSPDSVGFIVAAMTKLSLDDLPDLVIQAILIGIILGLIRMALTAVGKQVPAANRVAAVLG